MRGKKAVKNKHDNSDSYDSEGRFNFYALNKFGDSIEFYRPAKRTSTQQDSLTFCRTLRNSFQKYLLKLSKENRFKVTIKQEPSQIKGHKTVIVKRVS